MTPLAASLSAVLLASWGYWAVAVVAVRRHFRHRAEPAAPPSLPPVSVLKPVRGADPGALQTFATFCAQAYPSYEVVFGVEDEGDHAIPVVQALQRAHPDREVRLLVAPARPAGANRKACLLEALARAARHDVLVAADADMRVGQDWLRRVVSTLLQPGVALVTCPYLAADASSPWARLEALHMGVTFLPSAVLAARLGVSFATGATIALRRADLERVGGFAAVKDHLADDFELGARTAGPGARVALCPELPRSVLGHSSLREEWGREVRWSRCTWASRPGGNLGYALTLTLPLALAFDAAQGGKLGAGAVVASLAVRCVSAAAVALATDDRISLRALSLLPVRDLLTAATWLAGLLGGRVVWRGEAFRVDREGRLHPLRARPEPSGRDQGGRAAEVGWGPPPAGGTIPASAGGRPRPPGAAPPGGSRARPGGRSGPPAAPGGRHPR
jgi:ceramide glucosyltransferase